jgi:hypothetical protein
MDGKERALSGGLDGLSWPRQVDQTQERFAFSPNSRHLAYAAHEAGGQLCVVVDGVAGPKLSSCLKFTFSPDTQHFAYIAWADQKSIVVLDNKPIRTIQVLDDGRTGWTNPNSFTFREDGSLQYLAVRDNRIYRVSERPGASGSIENQQSANLQQTDILPGEPSPEGATSSASDQDTASVQEFIRGFWDHHKDNDPNGWAADFGSRVKYCYSSSNQLTDQQFISRDRAELVSEYPMREYRFYGLRIQIRPGADVANVTYSFKYSYTGRKLATGVCHVALTLQQVSGRWAIVSYDEKVDRK